MMMMMAAGMMNQRCESLAVVVSKRLRAEWKGTKKTNGESDDDDDKQAASVRIATDRTTEQ